MHPHSFSKRQLAVIALDENEKNAALSDKKKCMWSLFTYLSPQFFFPYTVTILLMWYVINSSHLRTNYINFSSISEDNQASLIASKHSKRSGDNVSTAHMIRIEHVGPMPSRHTFSLGNGDWTELRRNGDVPFSVNISV